MTDVWRRATRSPPVLRRGLHLGARQRAFPVSPRVQAGVDSLFFIALLQPLGPTMPIAEAQGRWIAAYLRGEYRLPSGRAGVGDPPGARGWPALRGVQAPHDGGRFRRPPVAVPARAQAGRGRRSGDGGGVDGFPLSVPCATVGGIMFSSGGTMASGAAQTLVAGVAQQASAPMLRLVITGSVDDGKSTLIGRLLYDSKQILTDQLEALRAASARRNGEHALDLSLLTDGLRAEREQGITIDVAYRYFQTAHRKFIIADTPGHERYTRNMVTGRLDGRSGRDPDRRAPGRRRADAPPRVHRLAARDQAPAGVRQQDGPGRLLAGRRSSGSSRTSASSARASRPPTSRSSRSPPCTGRTWSSARSRWSGTRGRRCCTTSSTSTSRPTAT